MAAISAAESTLPEYCLVPVKTWAQVMRTIAVRLGLRYSHFIPTVMVPLLFFFLVETGSECDGHSTQSG